MIQVHHHLTQFNHHLTQFNHHLTQFHQLLIMFRIKNIKQLKFQQILILNNHKYLLLQALSLTKKLNYLLKINQTHNLLQIIKLTKILSIISLHQTTKHYRCIIKKIQPNHFLH